jgi:hypothetical protein
LKVQGDAMSVPLEIALLFDVSASTDAMFRFQQQTAAKVLKEVLRPDDRATIYTVGQKPILVQGRDTAERSVGQHNEYFDYERRDSVLRYGTNGGRTAKNYLARRSTPRDPGYFGRRR